MSGQVAMELDGIWLVADFASITDFEWDMALLPKNPQTGKFTTTLESDGWWIFKEASDPDAGFRLLTFLSARTGQEMFAALDFFVPPVFPEVSRSVVRWRRRRAPYQGR